MKRHELNNEIVVRLKPTDRLVEQRRFPEDGHERVVHETEVNGVCCLVVRSPTGHQLNLSNRPIDACRAVPVEASRRREHRLRQRSELFGGASGQLCICWQDWFAGASADEDQQGKDALPAKLAKWLEESGRALELRAARIFWQRNWRVSTSFPYVDEFEPHATREGDVFGDYEWTGLNGARCLLRVVTECKNTPGKPWVALYGDGSRASLGDLTDFADFATVRTWRSSNLRLVGAGCHHSRTSQRVMWSQRSAMTAASRLMIRFGRH